MPPFETVVQRFHPDDQPIFAEKLERARRERAEFEVDYRIIHPGGEIRDIHGVGHPVLGRSGDLIEFVGSVIDVTERKRAEEALQAAMSERTRLAGFREEIGLALAHGVDLRGILQDCAEGMVRSLDAAFARIWILSSDGRELQLQASAGMYTRLDGSRSRIPFGQPKIGLIAQERRPYLTNDVQNDPQIQDKDWARREGMVSFAGYPLLVEDRVVGVMGMFSQRALPQSTVETLSFVADTIAQGIERKRAEEMARQSENELRHILDFAPQHVAVLGPDRARLYINQASLDYFGLTHEEWQAGENRAPVHPDDWERLMSESQSKFSSGIPHEAELRLRRKDGTYRWFLFRYNPLRDEQGRLTRWYAAGIDIEDRKQAEQRLQNENVALREEIDRASMFEEIVGISPALRAVLSRVSMVAPTDSTVLISGETGTGKELIARAVHKRSQRSSRPFVSVNCAAIPRDLIASELFGHEKGAFTGAMQRRLGRFELAEGGTIFLDEIGELPAETQIALLRVLQEREFERVGGTGSIQANVRVIAATNRDLQAAIAGNTFRSDLFYRLNVFPIEVPPLRERREDIPVLVAYFIDRFARKAGKSFRTVSKQSLEFLQSYPWPGNIRELQNIIERSVIVCEAENFSVDESWLSRQPLRSEPKSQPELSQKLAAQEKEMIENALRESRGRVSGPSGAAVKLGIPGSTLDSKIRSLMIDKNRFKSADPSINRT